LVEEGGVFWLTKPKGVLAPRCMAHTAVCFRGIAAANYWQRIVCLVKVGGMCCMCDSMYRLQGVVLNICCSNCTVLMQRRSCIRTWCSCQVVKDIELELAHVLPTVGRI
jgi:hypothetical protein